MEISTAWEVVNQKHYPLNDSDYIRYSEMFIQLQKNVK
jgi:hypothetical protein